MAFLRPRATSWNSKFWDTFNTSGEYGICEIFEISPPPPSKSRVI